MAEEAEKKDNKNSLLFLTLAAIAIVFVVFVFLKMKKTTPTPVMAPAQAKAQANNILSQFLQNIGANAGTPTLPNNAIDPTTGISYNNEMQITNMEAGMAGL